MADYSYKDPSNVSLNKGHKHTDDFITKKYILPMLRDPQKLKELIDEHRATPFGRAATGKHGVVQHSQDLQTLLDKLRRGGLNGKLLIICVKLHEDYRIGISTGVRGQPVEITEDSFSSQEACEHAIFLKRINKLLEDYIGE
ncbi:MAG: inner-membrane translocator [Proteobacteria bacterium]|nr:inner-membrane translocator [Pseudomonadota bacterium]